MKAGLEARIRRLVPEAGFLCRSQAIRGAMFAPFQAADSFWYVAGAFFLHDAYNFFGCSSDVSGCWTYAANSAGSQ